MSLAVRKVEDTSGLDALISDLGTLETLARLAVSTSTIRLPDSDFLDIGRQLNGAAAILSLSVLCDSALEHYRGSFHNRVMYTPLVVSALTLGASLSGIASPKAKRHPVRDSVYATAGLIGLAGLGFHAYNVLKRPGGLSWLNLFYSAPVGAPAALALAGALGRCAEIVRGTSPGEIAKIMQRPAGKFLSAFCTIGIWGTVAEAALLHFRGSFQNPAMYLPVSIPPAAGLLLVQCVGRAPALQLRLARWALRLTAILGFAGSGFHVYGVSRAMGGWRNWTQNLLNGPPIPAPPSFTGLALAGLAALRLREKE
ncbi:hypothetical protein ABID08_005842 [Rhizobium binae]|uniref:Uncharacterized protein n=1 Tax=Rhizobium binae TaxID=1138190 RepID=A0ABV2MPS7_9HYPH|nr:hypothetical protein [Rhizobium binae]MBX4994910.1 hypothetical protein [Rhizobium binae]NKL52550.1 hypothetical protein [Rhizobium leguminosarum bv. viciae]QSY84998.1 hypothetical protein J2J99_25805 [Rhizobium binae]